jgi:GTP-binding protein HflX
VKYRRRTAPRPGPVEDDPHLLVRPQRALLVGAVFPGQDRATVEDHLDELGRLTETAGGTVVARRVQERRQIDPAWFIGRGAAEQIGEMAAAHRADVVIFDDDLSPAQVRNLEEALGARVVDRSGLILDIFAKRARSREAKTQVELARLRYLLPRLRGGWTHLSRQEGRTGARGGIGETQIELDRRIIWRRIHRLEQDLQRIEADRRRRRTVRQGAVKVALIGYTNAGKTTLFNALTREQAFVEDRLFATLDPLVRRVRLKVGKDVLVIDTVGFIRKLPHNLVASFRSTLEEVREADVLIHVVDVSHPDYEEQMRITEEVLGDLRKDDGPIVTVFNKADRVAETAILERAVRLNPGALLASAAKGRGITAILNRLEELLHHEQVERDVRLGSDDTAGISRVYALAEVLETNQQDGFVEIRFRTSRARARALAAGLALDEAG